MNDRFYSTLGLSMRAGKLSFGYDTVKAAVQEGKVFLLLTASDLSEKSGKEVRYLSEHYEIPLLPLPKTQAELRGIIGKLTGILAVTDKGLAQSLLKAAESRCRPGGAHHHPRCRRWFSRPALPAPVRKAWYYDDKKG